MMSAPRDRPSAGFRDRLGFRLRKLVQAAYENHHHRLASWLLPVLRVAGPESWWDLDMRGLIAERRDDLQAATRWYEKAAAHGNAGPHPRMRLAYLYARDGRTDDALEIANQLRRDSTVLPGFAYDFGALLAREDRHADALEWFEIAAEGGDLAARMCIAHSLINLGRTSEAAALYRVLDVDGVHPSVRLRSALGIAKTEFDLGRLPEALEVARDAVARLGSTVDEADQEDAREVIAWLESEHRGADGSP